MDKKVAPEVVEPVVVEPVVVEPEVVEPERAVLEMDEMSTFVGKRKRKVGLWLAVERASRRMVAWVLGCRGAATGRRLFQSLPAHYQVHQQGKSPAGKSKRGPCLIPVNK